MTYLKTALLLFLLMFSVACATGNPNGREISRVHPAASPAPQGKDVTRKIPKNFLPVVTPRLNPKRRF